MASQVVARSTRREQQRRLKGLGAQLIIIFLGVFMIYPLLRMIASLFQRCRRNLRQRRVARSHGIFRPKTTGSAGLASAA